MSEKSITLPSHVPKINRLKSSSNNYSDTLFLICDIQQKFKPVMKNYETCVTVASRLAHVFAKFGIELLVTEQYPRGLGKTDEGLAQQIADSKIKSRVLEKTVFSMVNDTTKKELNLFQEKQKFVIVGFEAHVCVLQTCLDLLEMGKTVFLVADGVDSRSSVDKSFALERLRHVGVEVVTHESLVFELVGEKENENFKFCSAMLKDLLHV